MSVRTQKAILKAMEMLHADVEELKQNDARQDQILNSQGQDIAELQRQMMEMRNRAIAAEARSRVPYREISARYGVSEGRISQIKAKYS